MRRRLLAIGVMIVFLVPFVTYALFVVFPGTESYVVASGSMGEAVPVGSLVYVAQSSSYAPGDVISFRDGDQIVTHRVVDQTADGYVTRGDANDHIDEGFVTEDEIIGEVVFVVPVAGYVVQFATTPAGIVLFVVAPGLSLLVLELARLGRVLSSDRS